MRGGWLAISIALASSAALAQTPSAQDEARAYFEQGRAAYDAGSFEPAAQAFRRAYLLSGRPELLYNVGQAELRLGRDSLALEAFEGFLRQAPADSARRSEVDERVRVLRGMGVEPASEGEVAAASRAAQGGGGGSSPAPYIVLGIGAAIAVGGAILLGVAASEASRVTNAEDGSSWSELEGVASGATAMWIAGSIALGVGVAAVGAGIGWSLASGSEGSAALRVSPNGIMLAGTFR